MVPFYPPDRVPSLSRSETVIDPSNRTSVPGRTHFLSPRLRDFSFDVVDTKLGSLPLSVWDLIPVGGRDVGGRTGIGNPTETHSYMLSPVGVSRTRPLTSQSFLFAVGTHDSWMLHGHVRKNNLERLVGCSVPNQVLTSDSDSE